MLKNPKRIIVCEKDENRIKFVNEDYPDVLNVTPEECLDFVRANSDHGGADVVLEVAGAEDTFELAWKCARPNAIVTVVALYDKAQTLPLPDMYGKNLTFKTGGGVTAFDASLTLLLDFEQYENDPYMRTLMREACHRGLYALVNSAAMNGVGPNTRISQMIFWPVKLSFALAIVFWGLTAYFAVRWHRRRKAWLARK